MNKKIAEIRKELEQAQKEERSQLLEQYASDTRAGVISLLEKYRKQEEKLSAERKRLEAMREFEHRYAHCTYICGIDEAGRGPLAGPVAAAAVILPKDCEILYLNDSKKLSPKRREELYDEILEKAVAAGIGLAEASRIDEINILQATYEAMRLAVGKLGIVPEVLLNDAVTIPGLSGCQKVILRELAVSRYRHYAHQHTWRVLSAPLLTDCLNRHCRLRQRVPTSGSAPTLLYACSDC